MMMMDGDSALEKALGKCSVRNRGEGRRETHDGMDRSCGCDHLRLNQTSRSEERSRRGGLRG